jgi:hypothetical protein
VRLSIKFTRKGLRVGGGSLRAAKRALPLPLSWTQVVWLLRVTTHPIAQNRHSKRVTAKIVFLKELQGPRTRKPQPRGWGFSLFAEHIIAQSEETF